VIGPAFVLAVLVGVLAAALYVFVRGTVGVRLPVILVAAILGAWAGDSLGARLDVDLVRLGDFHLAAAFLGAVVGIGIVSILAALGPERKRT
jgi:uncharacterized membrane protein YeaQ/YmgE (transglycosylase-associated protein family)